MNATLVDTDRINPQLVDRDREHAIVLRGETLSKFGPDDRLAALRTKGEEVGFQASAALHVDFKPEFTDTPLPHAQDGASRVAPGMGIHEAAEVGGNVAEAEVLTDGRLNALDPATRLRVASLAKEMARHSAISKAGAEEQLEPTKKDDPQALAAENAHSHEHELGIAHESPVAIDQEQGLAASRETAQAQESALGNAQELAERTQHELAATHEAPLAAAVEQGTAVTHEAAEAHEHAIPQGISQAGELHHATALESAASLSRETHHGINFEQALGNSVAQGADLRNIMENGIAAELAGPRYAATPDKERRLDWQTPLAGAVLAAGIVGGLESAMRPHEPTAEERAKTERERRERQDLERAVAALMVAANEVPVISARTEVEEVRERQGQPVGLNPEVAERIALLEKAMELEARERRLTNA